MMVIHRAVLALKNGQFRVLFNTLCRRLWSTVKLYGFQWNLSQPLETKPPRIQVHIRELRNDDIPALLNLEDAKDQISFRDIALRLSMIKADIPTCYVAVTDVGIPCNMHWMIGSDANDKVQRFSNGVLPVIKEDEVLVEYAFTPERFRKQGINVEVLRYLFRLAQGKGMKRAILFISAQNWGSLKIVSMLGFTPFCLRTYRRRLFLRHITCEHIPKETAQKQIQEQLCHAYSGEAKPDEPIQR